MWSLFILHQTNKIQNSLFSIVLHFCIVLKFQKVVLIISTIQAAPGTTTANKCNECPLDYKPVCGGPAGATDNKLKKSFGSICVMQKYNCEKNER